MITPWTIYWIGILDSVSTFLTMVTTISSVSVIPFAITEKWRLIKVAISIAAFCGLVATVIPSSKLAAAMYIVPAVANNEDVRAIGGNSLKALRKLSEEWLLELADIDGEDKKGKKEADI